MFIYQRVPSIKQTILGDKTFWVILGTVQFMGSWFCSYHTVTPINMCAYGDRNDDEPWWEPRSFSTGYCQTQSPDMHVCTGYQSQVQLVWLVAKEFWNPRVWRVAHPILERERIAILMKRVLRGAAFHPVSTELGIEAEVAKVQLHDPRYDRWLYCTIHTIRY